MRATLRLDDVTRPWPALLDLACRAESAGWHAVRVGDPVGGGDPAGGAASAGGGAAPGGGAAVGGGDPAGGAASAGGASPRPECWTVLGALATRVPRVRLDAVVCDGRGRHPAVVAKLASTIDLLSEGRLLLGLALATDGDARDRLGEAFQVVKMLATQPRATFGGRFYRLRDAPLDPKPQQQPLPLMLVGGDSEMAARVADHWSLVGRPELVALALAQLAPACARAGRDRSDITVSGPYRAAGVDEWVVPSAVLGRGRAEQDRSLARIVAEAAAST